MLRNDASKVTRIVGVRSHTVIPSVRSLSEPWHVATACCSVQHRVQAMPREHRSFAHDLTDRSDVASALMGKRRDGRPGQMTMSRPRNAKRRAKRSEPRFARA